MRFTPAGGAVSLTLARSADGAPATIEVADTGPGIPADELPLLFSRFFRSRTATAANVPGTGLGLAIAKTIAEAHGGTIAADGVEGEETRFTVSLPIG